MAPPASAHACKFPRAHLAIATAGLALLGLLTLSSNGATRMLAWPWWAAWRALLAVPPALLLLETFAQEPVDDSARTRMPRMFVACLVAFAGLEVLSAAMSAHPRDSLGAAFTFISACCAVFVLARVREKNSAGLSRALGFAGAAFALVSLGVWLSQVVIPGLHHLGELNAAAGARAFRFEPDAFRNERPLGHSNYTAGVALLALPWLVALAWRGRGQARVGWSAGAVLVAATLVSSQSRGAIIGLGAGAAVALFLVTRAARWSRRRTAVLACGALVLLALLAMSIPRVRRPLLELAAGRGPNIGDQQRLAMARVGAAMGAERWWIGQGPGLTPRLYPKYRHTVKGGVDTALQLHSTPLQIWADTGLPGILAATGLSALAMTFVLRRRRTDPEAPAPFDKDEELLAGAAGVSFAGYAAFAFTDYQLDLPIVAAWIAADLAVVASRTSAPKISIRAKPVVWLATAFALAGLVVLTIPEWRTRRAYAGAVDDLEHGGDAAVFDERVDSIAKILPDNPQFFAGAAAAHLRLAPSANPEDRPRHAASARLFLERALAIEPRLEFAHFNLGWLLLASDPAQAAAHFRAAQHLVPDRGGVYLGLGFARLETGDTARGVDALALEILDDPIFLTSPAWDSPMLAPHFAAAARRALEIADQWRTTTPSSPALVRTDDLLRWWLDDDNSDATAVVGDVPLKEALANPQERRTWLARFFFIQTQTHATDAELNILESLIDRCGADWRAWLRAPEGRRPPFVSVLQRERPGYAMLAGNMDIPVPLDAYVVRENRIAKVFFGSVFPPRGDLPDSLFIEYVAQRDL